MRIPTAIWVASLALVCLDGQGLTTAEAAPASFSSKNSRRPRYYVPRPIKRQVAPAAPAPDVPPPSAILPPDALPPADANTTTEVIVETGLVVPVPLAASAEAPVAEAPASEPPTPASEPAQPSPPSAPPIIVPVALPSDQQAPSVESVEIVVSTVVVTPVPVAAPSDVVTPPTANLEAPSAPESPSLASSPAIESQESALDTPSQPSSPLQPSTNSESQLESPAQPETPATAAAAAAAAASSRGIPPIVVPATSSAKPEDIIPAAAASSAGSSPAVPPAAKSDGSIVADSPEAAVASTGGIPSVVVLPNPSASPSVELSNVLPLVASSSESPGEEVFPAGIVPSVTAVASSGGIPDVVVLPTPSAAASAGRVGQSEESPAQSQESSSQEAPGLEEVGSGLLPSSDASQGGVPPLVVLPTPSLASDGEIPPIVVSPTLPAASEGEIPPIVVLPTPDAASSGGIPPIVVLPTPSANPDAQLETPAAESPAAPNEEPSNPIIVGLSTVLSGVLDLPTPVPEATELPTVVIPVPLPSGPLGTGAVNPGTEPTTPTQPDAPQTPATEQPATNVPPAGSDVLPPGVLPSGSQIVVGTGATAVIPLPLPTPEDTGVLPEPQPPKEVPPPAADTPTLSAVTLIPGVTNTGVPSVISPDLPAATGSGDGVTAVPPVVGSQTPSAGNDTAPTGAVPPTPVSTSASLDDSAAAVPTPSPVLIPLPDSPSGVTTVPAGGKNTQQVLPTGIVVEPENTQASSASSTESGIPSNMPKVIQPPEGTAARPDNSVLIQIGFQHPLNYAFVSSNTSSARQIFHFLPQGVGYGIGTMEVKMQSIQPYDTSKSMGFITALGLMYVPKDSVNQLSIDLHTPHSAVYQNPDRTVSTLMGLINPAIPLIAGQPLEATPSESTGNGVPSESPGSFSGGSPFGSDAGNSEPVSTSAATIAAPVAAGTLLYGAAMVYFTRRIRQKRAEHRRSSSVTGDPAWMSGARASHNTSRDSRGSGNTSGRSVRTQQISAPVMAENSLGWN